MAQYKVQDPQGNIRVIEGPDGATDTQVLAQAQQLFGGQQSTQTPAAAPAPNRISQEDLNAQVLAMTKAGHPAADIRQYMKANGWDVNAAGDHALSLYENQRLHGTPYQVGTVQAPGEIGQSEMTKPVAHTDANPLQAALIGAGDTVTLGHVPQLTALAQSYLPNGLWVGNGQDYQTNVDRNRAILNGLEQDNPWSLNAGRVAGAFGMFGGAIVNGGKDATVLGNIARAGVQGGIYGQGSSTADTVGGQAADALKGAALGVAGDRVIRGAGRVLAPVGNSTVQALRSLGLTPTPGQLLLGQKGAAVEDLAGSLFHLGENTARQQQYQQLERNALQNTADAHGFATSFPSDVPTKNLPDYAINQAQSVADNMTQGSQRSVDLAKRQFADVAQQSEQRAQKIFPPTEITGAQMLPLTVLPQLGVDQRKQLTGMLTDAIGGIVSNYSPHSINDGIDRMVQLAQDPRLDQILTPTQKTEFINGLDQYATKLENYSKQTYPQYFKTQSEIGATQDIAQRDAQQANDLVGPAKEGFQVFKDAKQIAQLRTGKANEPYTAQDLQMANQYTPDQVAAYFKGGQLPDPGNRSWAAGEQADLITRAFGPNKSLAAPAQSNGTRGISELLTALQTHGASIPLQVGAAALYTGRGQRLTNQLYDLATSRPDLIKSLGQAVGNAPASAGVQIGQMLGNLGN